MMTETDQYVQRVIEFYYDLNGKYPPRVEVTDELRQKMTQRCFYFIDMEPLRVNAIIPESSPIKKIEVPVVAVGDDIMQIFTIQHANQDLQLAEYGAKLQYDELICKLLEQDVQIDHVKHEFITGKRIFEGNYIYRITGAVCGHESVLKDLKKQGNKQR